MLNLKGKLIIDDKNYDIEINGDISSFKFDNQLFVRQDETQETQDQDDGEVRIAESKKTTRKKQASRRTNWSKEGRELVRKYYPNMTAREIVEKNLIPGRTEGAIHHEAFLLGVKKYKKRKQKPEPKKPPDIIGEEISEPSKSNIEQVKQQKKYTTVQRGSVAVKQECIDYLKRVLDSCDKFSDATLLGYIKYWYKTNMGREINNKRGEIYLNEYKSYMYKQELIWEIRHNINTLHNPFDKQDSDAEVKETLEDDEKPNITVVGVDDKEEAGDSSFIEHKHRRITELHERERKFKHAKKLK